jgi:queuine tRNA-ribosyltransferase
MSAFSFQLRGTDGQARRGRVTTAHGSFETPAFMPVGTAGTVKGMTPEAVAQTGAGIILGNTYHLMLRPGAERMERLGGLHTFMNWQGPILTDSGGFQVMSLTDLRKMSEKGVVFRSHVDGSYHELTPERSMEIQRMLGSDITMAFDECTPFPATHEEAQASMELSMRWAERSRAAFTQRPGHGLFGIVQGGVYEDLRAQSSETLCAIGFDGYALGGLAVGEGCETMLRMIEVSAPMLPQDHPRYLMGVGRPEDLVEAVRRGVDMFDCVMPTRSGRTGQAFTRGGPVNIRNARHAEDSRPLDEGCGCPACTRYGRAYLHHLVRTKEILGSVLLTWHNLHYYQDLMAGIRQAVEEEMLDAFATAFAGDQARGDIEPL